MNKLLTMQVDVEGLSDVIRADSGENTTYEDVITMAMIQEAMLGNVKAYQAIMQVVGQTDKSEEDLEEQKIRTDRAKRARDQELGDTDGKNEKRDHPPVAAGQPAHHRAAGAAGRNHVPVQLHTQLL